MSPGWLGLRDILRLSRGRWGRGPAPRWVTAGPTGHGTLYSPPVLPPLLAQGSLGSAGQFWVCVCVCAHTRVGRGGRDRGPDGSTAVSLVRGQDLLRGSCPRLGPPYCGTPGFQVRRQRDRARQPCITRVCTSPVAQWLGLHTPSQEFDPWSGNSTPWTTTKTHHSQMAFFFLKRTCLVSVQTSRRGAPEALKLPEG